MTTLRELAVKYETYTLEELMYLIGNYVILMHDYISEVEDDRKVWIKELIISVGYDSQDIVKDLPILMRRSRRLKSLFDRYPKLRNVDLKTSKAARYIYIR